MPSESQLQADRERHALCLEIGRMRRRVDRRAIRLVDRVPIPGLTFGSFRRHPLRWLLSAGTIGLVVGRWTAARRASDRRLRARFDSARQAVVRFFCPEKPQADDSADSRVTTPSETDDV